jgi:hypothetical protein
MKPIALPRTEQPERTRREILRAAVDIASAKGWKGHLQWRRWMPRRKFSADATFQGLFTASAARNHFC